MKQCPTCNRTYADDSITFCLADGSLLSAPYDPEATQRIPTRNTDPPPTEVLPSNQPHSQPMGQSTNPKLMYVAIGLLALLVGGGIVALLKSNAKDASPTESQNASSGKSANVQAPVKSANTPTLAPREWTVNVPMAIPWTNTNIQVKAGQTLTIHASGKGVWKNVAGGRPKPYEECDPDGTPPINSADYYSNISLYQSSDAYKGALIGKIGQNGTPFPIGSNFSQVINQSGILYLGINDMKPEVDNTAWRDNSGGFTAKVKLND